MSCVCVCCVLMWIKGVNESVCEEDIGIQRMMRMRMGMKERCEGAIVVYVEWMNE